MDTVISFTPAQMIALATAIITISTAIGVVINIISKAREPEPGFQGVTPLEYDCRQCGECYLNITGGICPITACSKSLINGQCGGAKNGMCEVDPNMECGWERIHRRLKQVGRLDALKCPVQIRNYATDDLVK